MALISIITVAYNAASLIAATINSVLSQKGVTIEYLIIDGASCDGTQDIVSSYGEQINYFTSQPDRGIYDAMNKGLRQATGKYVLFLNAGDQLANPHILFDILGKKPNTDIYYADTELIDLNGKSLGARRLRPPSVLTDRSFLKGMLVCHQSFIVKRNLAPAYNLKYQVSADIDWCIRCLRSAETFRQYDGYLSKYLVGGFSARRRRKALKERFEILTKYYGLPSTLLAHVFILSSYLFRLPKRNAYVTVKNKL